MTLRLHLNRNILHDQQHRNRQPLAPDESCPICYRVTLPISTRFQSFWVLYQGVFNGISFTQNTINKFNVAEAVLRIIRRERRITNETRGIINTYKEIITTIRYRAEPRQPASHIACIITVTSLYTRGFSGAIDNATLTRIANGENPFLLGNPDRDIAQEIINVWISSRDLRGRTLLTQPTTPRRSGVRSNSPRRRTLRPVSVERTPTNTNPILATDTDYLALRLRYNLQRQIIYNPVHHTFQSTLQVELIRERRRRAQRALDLRRTRHQKAVLIQKNFRGFSTRLKLKKEQAAIRIQKIYRGYNTRTLYGLIQRLTAALAPVTPRVLHPLYNARYSRKQENAGTKIQKIVRGYLTRTSPNLRLQRLNRRRPIVLHPLYNSPYSRKQLRAIQNIQRVYRGYLSRRNNANQGFFVFLNPHSLYNVRIPGQPPPLPPRRPQLPPRRNIIMA